jgi:hypothetical protein
LGLLVSPAASKLLEYLQQKHPDTPHTNQGFVNMINYMSREWEYYSREFYDAGIGATRQLIPDAQKEVKKQFQDLLERLEPIVDRSLTESSSEDEALLQQEVESVIDEFKFSHHQASLEPIEKLKERYHDFPEAFRNIEALSSSFENLVSEVEKIQEQDQGQDNLQGFEDHALSAGKKWLESLVIDSTTQITLKKLLKTVDQKSETLLKETPDSWRNIEENTDRIKYAIVHALIIEPRLEEFSAQLERRIFSPELRRKIDRTLNLMFTPEFISHYQEVAHMQSYEHEAYKENRVVRDMLMAPFKS